MLGGLCASWAIGAFFMFPYLVPAQVGGIERQITGKDHTSMYFATRIVCTTIVGAFGSSLVYDNIKNFFVSKAGGGVVFAEGYEKAAVVFSEKLGENIQADQVFNFGLLLVPIIVSVACLVGFVFAFRLPRDFSQKYIAEELKKQHPEYDISKISAEEEAVDETENVFVMVALWVLTGGIFGFIWAGVMAKKIATLTGKKPNVAILVLSYLVPFVGIVHLVKCNEALKTVGKDRKIPYIIFGILIPLLAFNPIALAIMQNDINKAISK